jgi:hypothetical protein
VRGRAYLITVGVNAYENPAWDLRFAANDARQLARALHERLAQSPDYEELIAISLLSDYATQNGIWGAGAAQVPYAAKEDAMRQCAELSPEGCRLVSFQCSGQG